MKSLILGLIVGACVLTGQAQAQCVNGSCRTPVRTTVKKVVVPSVRLTARVAVAPFKATRVVANRMRSMQMVNRCSGCDCGPSCPANCGCGCR